MVTVAEALAIGTRHYHAGELAAAERVARQVLEIDPKSAQAWHLSGLVALQAHEFAAAADRFSKAIGADRSNAAYFANLGEANLHLGRAVEAIECFEKALQVQPNMAHAHARLGLLHHTQGRLLEAAAALRRALQLKPDDVSTRRTLGHVLFDQNKLADAEACYRRVLRERNGEPDAYYDLGIVLHRQGKLAEAAACYRAALDANPQHVNSHNNLGALLKDQGLLDESQSHFEAALRANPRDANAHANLADLFQAQGRLDESLASYRAALDADPSSLRALNGLGIYYLRRRQLNEAGTCFQKVLDLDPRAANAALNLGNVLQSQGKFQAAIDSFQAAIRIDPRMAEAYNNLGTVWNDQQRRDEAIANYRRAIELDPRYGFPHSNMGVALQWLGRVEEAIACFRKAVELMPNGRAHHSNLLCALNYDPSYDARAVFAEHRSWGQRFADPLTAQSRPHENDRTLDRRLRVGYVSPNFRHQAVNFFSEPILASHDHRQFEIFCYSDVAREDETTQRLRGYADHWRTTVGETDEKVSDLVRRDQIDILVDLTGHIGDNRMFVFARKPAPIQVTYIGYQNTTGMLAMDYRLTDAYCDPPGLTDAFYTERLIRLPRSFFCYRPAPDAPAVSPPPVSRNGFVTFGSFNNFSKVGPRVLETWATMLAMVPRSRLIILADVTESLTQRVSQIFASHGITADRLELAHRRPPSEYLELIQRVDIALDPFPFNGHTTTCDALWQGVPVVTLSGQTYVSRFGGSALATLGLDGLIAHSEGQYAQIAAELAADVQRFTHLRATLREQMAGSPLLDFPGFTRNLEAAYRQMWTTWCEQVTSGKTINP